MTPRRFLPLIVAGLILVLTPLLVVPLAAQETTTSIVVNRLTDDDVPPIGTPYCIGGDSRCSLRQALTRANEITEGRKNISFAHDIFGAGGVIQVTNGKLPALTSGNIHIQGLLPGGPNSAPIIAIVGGPSNSSRGVGLQIRSDNNSVSNLIIYGFNNAFADPEGGSGIHIFGSSNNRITNCYIGLARDGAVAVSNARGITLVAHDGSGSNENIIERNVISGNLGIGISLNGASRNQILGNYIGARPGDNQLEPLGNGSYGIQITSSSLTLPSEGNVIGGTGQEQANIIVGNSEAGIRLNEIGARQNLIQGNYIGAHISSIPLSNVSEGIIIEEGANNNVLAGSAGSPLIVSGNLRAGVLIQGPTTANNRIEGRTLIGVDYPQTGTLGNEQEGVRIAGGAPGTRITGSGVAIAGNGIGANAEGINLRIEGGARDTVVDGILVGAVLNGGVITTLLPPRPVGIQVGSSLNTLITNTTVIGHANAGIELRNPTAITVTTSRLVSNPGTGLNAESGTNLVLTSNEIRSNGAGILLNSTRQSLIDTNLLSGNGGDALRLTNAQTTTVQFNTVGLTVDQREAWPNGGGGMVLLNSPNTLITENAVAANTGPGISLNGAGTFSTTLTANVLGLRRAATEQFALPAANLGPQISVGASVTQLSIRTNTLAGAEGLDPEDQPIPGTHPAIQLTGPGIRDVAIQGNQIGWVLRDQPEPLMLVYPHTAGIVAVDVRNLLINENNTIRYNLGDAIQLTNALSVTLSGNTEVGAQPALLGNGGVGLRLLGATRQVSVTNNQIVGHGADGINVTGNAQNLVIAENALRGNGGDAISLSAIDPLVDQITNTAILSNTLSGNVGRAIALTGNVQRASFFSNSLAENGEGIVLSDTTTFVPPETNPGLLSNPNHDLDPPVVGLEGDNLALNLQLSNTGVVAGYILTNTVTTTVRSEADLTLASACVTCTIQFFAGAASTEPGQVPQPGQGLTLIPTTPLFSEVTADRFTVTNANGYFERRLAGGVPTSGELLMIATDGFGNSSAYAVFMATTGLEVGPATAAGSVVPGGTVAYTLQLTNTGSLVLSDLRLTAENLPEGWALGGDPDPSTFIALAVGEKRTITVTLRAPTGTSPLAGQVIPVTLNVASIGDPNLRGTVRLNTTILPFAALTVTPTQSTGAGEPESEVSHVYTVSNAGNVPLTVRLSATTPLVPRVDGSWVTSVTPETITNLAPGSERSVEVRVRIPEGAPMTNVQGFPTATTTAEVVVDGGNGFAGFTQTVTARTRVLLVTAVSLSTNPPVDSSAGERQSFIHTVRNLSNSSRQFCLLEPVTSQGSIVQIVSATTGFVIDGDRCFRLYTTAEANPGLGRYNEAQFEVIVLLPRELRAGTIETITLSLRDGLDGEVLGGARATNTIRITQSVPIPAIWLPLVSR